MNNTDNPAFSHRIDPSDRPASPRDDGNAGAVPDFGPGAFFAPALRGDSDQFPVLKAFQAYVEEERERARRRVVVVSTFSIAAITVLVTLFVVALWFMMRRNDQLNDRLLNIVASHPAALAAPPPVPVPKAQTATDGPLPAAPVQDERASDLQMKLAALEEANAAMVRRFEELQNLPDALAASVGGMISNAMEHAVPPATASSPPPPEAPRPSPGNTSSPGLSAQSAQPKAPTTFADPVAEPTAKAPSDQAEVNAIRVKPIAQTKPTISGYRTEHILLRTDAGVTIPWRIATPE